MIRALSVVRFANRGEQTTGVTESLVEALEQVHELIARLESDGYIPEPWLGDEVSRNVHRFYTDRVMGPVGTPMAALKAYRRELEGIRDKLQEIEDHYRRTEGENVDRWEDMLLIPGGGAAGS